MNIAKSAPLPERPCEQLTYCAKNESVQWDYINRVAKRHNCRITGKRSTRYGGPSTKLHVIPTHEHCPQQCHICGWWAM
ncbi:hypothetical protein ACLB1S_20370 [Escherichia coli]